VRLSVQLRKAMDMSLCPWLAIVVDELYSRVIAHA
jgi:hypothetical protein